jgi:Zn finger protein HypA/HybF involved in hydrogenase expression
MSEMKLPKFESDEEEAAFWDSVDTAQIMEEGEEIELEYKPETAIENICIHCGEKMIERNRDIDVPGEEITIHIKEYYCPRCKKSRLGSEEAKRLSQILVWLPGEREEGIIETDTEVYKDKEGYFVRIPTEIVQNLDMREKKRTKIWSMGKRIILEIK